MKTIYKYPLDLQTEQIIKMPVGFQLLDMQNQDGVPCIWALVNGDNALIYVKFFMYGTGEKINHTDLNYLGTFQFAGGNLVFHVFYKIL